MGGSGEDRERLLVPERLVSVAGALEERGLRWAALGARHLAGAVDKVDLLVHPYDAPRARVTLAARGFKPAGGGGAHVRYLASPMELALHSGLAPVGWSELPISPFLDGSEVNEDDGIRRMGKAAAWAAQRLLNARDLWHPATVSAVALAWQEALARGLDDADRELWAEAAKRWGIAGIWRRCDELETWLGGGPRPDWLQAGFGEASAVAGAPPGWPPLTLTLALQDDFSRRAACLARRILRRS